MSKVEFKLAAGQELRLGYTPNSDTQGPGKSLVAYRIYVDDVGGPVTVLTKGALTWESDPIQGGSLDVLGIYVDLDGIWLKAGNRTARGWHELVSSCLT